MTDFSIKQGDTSPSIISTLKDEDGNAVDVTEATVRFHMADKNYSVVLDKPASVTDGPNGKVKYDWDAEDTDRYGSFLAEWEVEYSDGRFETFPNTRYISIYITRELA